MDKQKFIEIYNKIMNGVPVTHEEFQNVINLLKVQGVLLSSYQPNIEIEDQRQNILEGIYQMTLFYFQVYLGQ